MPWAKVRAWISWQLGTGRRNRSQGGVDWIRPVRKTFRTRVLCAHWDPRALLICSVVYTGYVMRRAKLSGFRERAPRINFQLAVGQPLPIMGTHGMGEDDVRWTGITDRYDRQRKRGVPMAAASPHIASTSSQRHLKARACRWRATWPSPAPWRYASHRERRWHPFRHTSGGGSVRRGA